MKLNYLLVGSIAAMKTPTLITATGKTLVLNGEMRVICNVLDVIDVLQDECHQAVYDGVPKQSMIKGWRKKFLEKSKNIKKFIELQSCAIFELDNLNPKLTEDPSADAFIQVRLTPSRLPIYSFIINHYFVDARRSGRKVFCLGGKPF